MTQAIRTAVIVALAMSLAPSHGPAQSKTAKRPTAGTPKRVAVATPPARTTSRPAQVVKRIVVIDAGHGGDRGGMRARLPDGKYIDEKTITLGIARKLRDELAKRGVEVVMTRDVDANVCPRGAGDECPLAIDLAERGRIANDARGDLFLSLHVNAPGTSEKNPRAVRGFETYFLAEAQTEDERRVERMENEVVRFETPSAVAADNPLAFIISDMAQNEHLRESLELAGSIQTGVGASHPGPSRGVKQANLAVLRSALMPAVLFETGFGSNATEAAWLASDAGQRQLAASLAASTLDYLSKYERRVRAGADR